MKTAINEANKALDFHTPSTELVQVLRVPAIPPTLNELLTAGKSPVAGSGQWKLSSLKREWTNDIEVLAIATLKPYLNQKIWVNCIWYVTFDRDFDNLHTAVKPILDGIVKAGTIRNDNLTTIQSPIFHWHERASKDNERVDMVIANTPRYTVQQMEKYQRAIADSLDRF